MSLAALQDFRVFPCCVSCRPQLERLASAMTSKTMSNHSVGIRMVNKRTVGHVAIASPKLISCFQVKYKLLSHFQC